MQPTVNELVVEQMSRGLVSLKGLLKRAQHFSTERKFDENNFLQLRLAADMFPFIKQVQITCDIVKGTCARLSGTTAPVFADDEKTIAELIQRIDKTYEYVQGFSDEKFHGYENRKISFPWKPGFEMMGHDYLISHAIPNFYFHLATAYAILRSNGVPLGKGDYLGELNWKNV